jgi:IS30 family transposase
MSADLRRSRQAELDAIAAQLNGRPRRTLGFVTPTQVFETIVRKDSTPSLSARGPLNRTGGR